MAIFKCKMCGGSTEVGEKQTVYTCDYCGAYQTLPRLDDEKRANMFDRANHFRRNNEFDKAVGIYDQILNEDNKDAEAYWSLVLCRYGVEYIADPSSRKHIPTINRIQYTSIFDDENYKSAIKYSDTLQRSIYEQEAKKINDIQKNMLIVSQKEEPFDIFICYKETDRNGKRTKDSVLAQELYNELTREGFKVFFSRITLEDKLGSAYEPYIFAALNSAKVMVVVGTQPDHFNAVWVKNEWSRFLALIKNGARKTLIPAYRDMDPYDLPEEFSHLQALDMSKLGFMHDLVRGIKKIVEFYAPKVAVKETVVRENTSTVAKVNLDTVLKRAFVFIEDEEWKKADAYCEKVLDVNPENAKAYLGKMLVELELPNPSDLRYVCNDFSKNSFYIKSLKYADGSFAEELSSYYSAWVKEGANRNNHICTKAIASKSAEKRYNEAYDLYESKEYTKAFNMFMTAANLWHAKAQFSVGRCYYHGHGVAQNYAKAVEWCTKSANQGFPVAQTSLGDCYCDGHGVAQNYAKAIEWYTKAAQQGEKNAQNKLGDFYCKGYGVAQNYAKAVEWFTKAADQGHPASQYNLASCYYRGHGVTQNYAKAVEWFTEAANQEFPAAQNYLGHCYYNGYGVTQNYKKAVEWFTKAADQGLPAAQNYLGIFYYRGHGVAQNYAKAVEWFTGAADQGLPAAQNYLGIFYYRGHGVAQNYAKAVEWFTRAADQGFPAAQDWLASCYYRGHGVEKNYVKAVELYTKAAEQGHLEAQLQIARCYEWGIGTKINLSTAKSWYELAAAKGSEKAKEALQKIKFIFVQ